MRKDKSGHCIKCGVFRNALHRDHIIPKWKDGIDAESNVQYLCANCHEDKTWTEHQSVEFKLFQGNASRKRWADSAMHTKITESMQGIRKSKETRKRMSEAAKAYRATPEGKAGLDKAREKVIDGWTSEARQKHSELNKKRLEDPEEYARHCAIDRTHEWTDEERFNQSLRMEERILPPRKTEHTARIVESRKRNQELLNSLSKQERAELKRQKLLKEIDKNEKKLAVLKSAQEREQEREGINDFVSSDEVIN